MYQYMEKQLNIMDYKFREVEFVARTGLNSTKLTGKIFTVIEHFAKCQTDLSLQEIAKELKLPKSTVHRLINDLKELGYVEQGPSKKYYLSYKFLNIGNRTMNKNNFVEKMIPYMNFFAKRYNFDMGLSGFYRENVIHLHSVYNALSFKLNPISGSILPAYCTAAGKLFLSSLSREQFTKYLSNTSLIPLTEYTIIDKNRLTEQIEKTKLNGFGIANSEYIEDVCCLALPLKDAFNRTIGTMNFSCMSDRYEFLTSKEFIKEAKGVLSDVIGT